MSIDLEIFTEYVQDPDDILDAILDDFEREFIDDEMRKELDRGLQYNRHPERSEGSNGLSKTEILREQSFAVSRI
jgi:hypothetical protein